MRNKEKWQKERVLGKVISAYLKEKQMREALKLRFFRFLQER